MSLLQRCFFLAFIFCFTAAAGCFSSSGKSEYVEGTSLTVGLYVPVNGTLYGVQALNFLTGKRLSTTNLNEFASTNVTSNTAFGVVSAQESTTNLK